MILELKLSLVEIVEGWAARCSWPVDCAHHDGLQNLQALLAKPPTKTAGPLSADQTASCQRLPWSCFQEEVSCTPFANSFPGERKLNSVCSALILTLFRGQLSTRVSVTLWFLHSLLDLMLETFNGFRHGLIILITAIINSRGCKKKGAQWLE